MSRGRGVLWGALWCGLVGCQDTRASERPERHSRAAGPKAACESCHADQAAQWERSRHHSAFTNPDFQRSFAREPKEFCRACHAPGTRDAAVNGAVAEARGVGCVDCHGELSAVRTGPGGQASAPHSLTRAEGFGTETCAACHEFAFPQSTRRPPGAMMQTTMREHSASEHAGTDCASCHLPRTPSGIDHSLASTRSDAAWREALSVEVQLLPAGVSFALTPHNVGHALPTGDLFRRLKLRTELRDNGETVASAHRYLGRHFEPVRRPDGTYNRAHDWPTPDDRLRGPTTVLVELPPSATGSEVLWWVDYERVDNRDPEHPDRSSLASTVGIASGRLDRSEAQSP